MTWRAGDEAIKTSYHIDSRAAAGRAEAHGTDITIAAELVRIEQEIKAGGIEPRILEEFRDSVDYVRKTAWAVQEWQERQLQKRDPQTVLPLITSERIRRATQLSLAITTDLAAHEVSRETTGMRELYQAVEGLYPRVASLFREV